MQTQPATHANPRLSLRYVLLLVCYCSGCAPKARCLSYLDRLMGTWASKRDPLSPQTQPI